METDATKIEDVVVVGYGVQKKASVLSAITQKKGEDLVRTGGVTNIGSSLTGLVPGLSTISPSRQPSDNTVDIYIRGVATWGSNEPLVLVDGIERDFNDVDPNDIFAVSILKDASATAVYGVRGGNGVILITTKRGKTGKPQLTYSSEVTFKKPSMLPNFISSGDQVMLMQQGFENDNPESTWGDLVTIHGFRYPSDEVVQHNYDQDLPELYPDADVIEELVKKVGYGHKHNLNISGGTKYVKYFTSLSYLYDGDVLNTQPQADYDPTFYHELYNLRSNLDINVTKTTKISANLSGILNNVNQPYEISAWQAKHENIVRWIMGGSTYLFPFEYENGTLGHNGSNFAMNPYAALNYAGQSSRRNNKMSMDYKLQQDMDGIVKGLSVSGLLSMNMLFKSNKNIVAPTPQIMYIDPATSDTAFIPSGDYWLKPADKSYYHVSGNLEIRYGNIGGFIAMESGKPYATHFDYKTDNPVSIVSGWAWPSVPEPEWEIPAADDVGNAILPFFYEVPAQGAPKNYRLMAFWGQSAFSMDNIAVREATMQNVTIVVDGTVEGDGAYGFGQETAIEAVNGTGTFARWDINGKEISTDATLVFTAYTSYEITAVFE